MQDKPYAQLLTELRGGEWTDADPLIALKARVNKAIEELRKDLRKEILCDKDVVQELLQAKFKESGLEVILSNDRFCLPRHGSLDLGSALLGDFRKGGFACGVMIDNGIITVFYSMISDDP